MASKKITITIQEDALQKLDKYASETGITRSAAITSLALNHLKQEEFMSAMPGLLELAKDQK